MLVVLRLTLLDVLAVIVASAQLAPLLVFSTELPPTILTPTTRNVAHSMSEIEAIFIVHCTNGLYADYLQLDAPRSLTVFDGEETSSGHISHVAVAPLRVGDHIESDVVFFLTQLAEFPVVIGMPWLSHHDVTIKASIPALILILNMHGEAPYENCIVTIVKTGYSHDDDISLNIGTVIDTFDKDGTVNGDIFSDMLGFTHNGGLSIGEMALDEFFAYDYHCRRTYREDRIGWVRNVCYIIIQQVMCQSPIYYLLYVCLRPDHAHELLRYAYYAKLADDKDRTYFHHIDVNPQAAHNTETGVNLIQGSVSLTTETNQASSSCPAQHSTDHTIQRAQSSLSYQCRLEQEMIKMSRLLEYEGKLRDAIDIALKSQATNLMIPFSST